MRISCTSALVLLAVSFLSPSAQALGGPPPVRDMYLRARERTRQGSEVRQIESAALSIWHSIDDDSSTMTHLLCSLRKSLPEGRGGTYMQQIAGLIASVVPGSAPSELVIGLTRHDFCGASPNMKTAPAPLIVIRLDHDGAVVSGNPVWNACVRGGLIPLELIRSNRDRSLSRSGHLRTWIPWSCRDYHKGPVDVWQHPDYPELSLVLDPRGRLMSALPKGYIAVREKTSSFAKSAQR